MMWSIACMAKLKVMNSTIGFRPRIGGAGRQSGEAHFGDRRIDDALRTELVEQALADLIGALVLGDFLAHQEDLRIAAHLFGHGVAQGLAHGLADRLGVDLFRRRRGGRLGRRREPAERQAGEPRRPWPVGPAGRLRSDALVFAVLQQQGDRRIDRHPFGAVGDQDLAQCPFVDRLDLHGGLVGLDLGQDVARLDGSPSLFSQRASLPSVMVGDKAGIRICIGISAPSQASTRTSVHSSAGSGSGTGLGKIGGLG